MSEIRSNAGFEGSGGDPLRVVRARILRAALPILAIAVPGVAAIIVVVSVLTHTLNAIAVVLAIYTLAFPLLWGLRRRLGFQLTAISLLALLALTAFLVEARGGMAAGNMLLNALVLTLGAVFFGRRGAVAGWVAVVGLAVAAAAIVLGGVGPPIELSMWDPTRAVFWLREVVALALLATVLVGMQVYVVDRLATEARRLMELAESEREQRLALERAEREREQERERRLEAVRALEESRKIEALARLAGGIAHDFNNALTVVMGAAGEIAAGGSPAENEANARAILESAQRGAELTRGLLTLGHGQATKPRPVSVGALLDRLAPAFRRVLPADIALEVDVALANTDVEVDPTGLERALLNLVINARDAMPRGGQLRIACAAGGGSGTPGPGDRVAVTVSDTGVGITAGVLEHIFDPFFTTKAPGLGTGLGLATVRAFAEESRGEVRVNSMPGVGTTFTLLLPARPEAGAAVAETAPAPPSAVSAAGRVLLVEDHESVRATMVRALARAGYEATVAADGDQAMAMLGGPEEFALLCIDGVMPGAPTSAVIERAERDRPTMRILLCSGYLPEDLLRRGVRTGRYAYLQKPFTPSEFVTAVGAALAAPEASAEA